jgi:hypothetical protein
MVRAQRHGRLGERIEEGRQGAGKEAAHQTLHHHRGAIRKHWRCSQSAQDRTSQLLFFFVPRTHTNHPQVELKLKYKFRLILDETWSYGVLGRTGRGVTEAQNVDAAEVDMIIGSLSGPLCAAGGFCAGNEEVVEHQRISSASYTYSAALPALLSTTASETISLLQEQPEILTSLRENIKAMKAQLDPRSDWVKTQSAVDNPMVLLTLKQEVIDAKKLTIEDQNQILRDVVDEVRPSL